MMQRFRPVAWLSARLTGRPLVADALLAAVVATASVLVLVVDGPNVESARDPNLLAVALSLGASLPLVLRRRCPGRVLAAVAVPQFTLELLDFSATGWAGVIVALYSLGAHGGHARLRAAAAFAVAMAALLVVGGQRGDVGMDELTGTFVTFPAAYLLGDTMRRRRERVAELVERAERAERERELLARQAVNDERARIARELHDVVAHAVSLMVVQAQAGQRQLPARPERAGELLGQIESTGRQAMDEMRRVLGVLRDATETPSRTPVPTIADIESLAAAEPTLPIRVHVDGLDTLVPASVSLSAYRIVQEAITNVRKHAGRPTFVDVSVTVEPDALHLRVVDDGWGAAADRGSPGHGLLGIRERAALCGGTSSSGPRPGGGWQVRAVLPLAGPGAP
jgi:signal transduction histidine kinase